jgi:hypothetical protein
MIPKSGNRFSERIMRKPTPEGDDDSKKSHPALQYQVAKTSSGAKFAAYGAPIYPGFHLLALRMALRAALK